MPGKIIIKVNFSLENSEYSAFMFNFAENYAWNYYHDPQLTSL